MAIKLFFFDMEGTLVHGANVNRINGYGNSLWARLTEALGPQAIIDDDEGIRKWDAGEFQNYMEWCDFCLRNLQKHGLTRQQFMHLVKESTIAPGAVETLAAIHAKGIKTAIVSGGFMAQAGRAQRALRINHAYAATKLFWTAEGTIEHWNLLPSDNEGKVDFVELMRREYGLTKEECAFVGDGKNDVHIAKHVGLSFAYNAHPDLQKVATRTITQLTEILQHI